MAGAEYSAENLLRVAKRQNNRKRKYILVNPWQGKHMPVSPSAALSMMRALGNKVAGLCGEARLVIGFAETATAIGAVVADVVSKDCIYVQTTREELPGISIEFMEEHSHAPEQRLTAEHFQEWLEHTDTVIFVDDEISTGRTLSNIIAKLSAEFPALAEKKMVAASILNRLSPEDEERLQVAGIISVCLVKLTNDDYSAMVENINTKEAASAIHDETYFYEQHFAPMEQDPRLGIVSGKYMRELEQLANQLIGRLHLKSNAENLVLGTEECMLPGLILGRALEEKGIKTYFHATTRSPISICAENEYPIKNGWEIDSLYDIGGNRKNYIYNLRAYSQVIILSDTILPEERRIQSTIGALRECGCGKIVYIGRQGDV